MNGDWLMSKPCLDCPFNKTGPGANLRKTLRHGRMAEIKTALLNNQHFTCHKTADETGDGSNKVCRGAYEWQEAHDVSANFVRICERISGPAEPLSKQELARLDLR